MIEPVKTIVTQRGEYRIYQNPIGRYTIMKVRGDNLTRVSSADTQDEAIAEMLRWADIMCAIKKPDIPVGTQASFYDYTTAEIDCTY